MMDFFKDVSIRGKIITALLVIVGLELLVFLTGIYFLRQVGSQLDTIIEIDNEKMKLAQQVNIDLLEMHRAQKNLLLSLAREDVDAYGSRLAQHKAQLQDHLSALGNLAAEDEQELISEFKAGYEAFLKVENRIEFMVQREWESAPEAIQEHSSNGRIVLNADAVLLSRGSGRAAYDKATESIQRIITRTEQGLDASKTFADAKVRQALLIKIALSIFGIAFGLSLGLFVARSITSSLTKMVTVADAIAAGRLDTPVEVRGGDEVGALADSVERMQTSLRKAADAASARDWLKTGIARLNDAMRGKVDMEELCTAVISEVATYLDAKVGAFFLLDGAQNEPVLKLAGGYAYSENHNPWSRFRLGEGLVGQSAMERRQIVLESMPEDHIKVVCGLGESCPRCACVAPFLYEGQVKGVIELGFTDSINSLKSEYLEQAMPSVAINIETARGREELAKALARSQTLTEELQAQQEELRAANEELEEQAQKLRQSEEELKAQQEELEDRNQLLEETNESLESQKHEIEQARQEVLEKAEQLAIASKYKSEFLANMSHELRTPLNSILLLARLLAENRDGSLSEEHSKSAHIIYNSGNDLLSLIDEILDLSRIEAGRMDLHVDEILVKDVADRLAANFQHMIKQKDLDFQVSISQNCPERIWTDRKRLEQILRNFLSNAIKFTDHGSIRIDFSHPAERKGPAVGASDLEGGLSIAVTDTGIGIAPDKQKIIFEAFQQVEGGSTRKYGGAGLGLSISRELARLLGGEIRLVSEPGKGSAFYLHLPLRIEPGEAHLEKPLEKQAAPNRFRGAFHTASAPSAIPFVPDDRGNLTQGDKVILVIEDDAAFAGALVGLCREKGFKCLVSPTGEDGLEIARKNRPSAVILDIGLPGMDGWAVLDALKGAPELRHIPVHIMSVEESTGEVLRRGAIGYLRKPVRKEDLDLALQRLERMFSRAVKELLVVEDDETLRKSIIRLIGNGDVHADEAASGEEALCALRSKTYDCVILDLGLPDMSGLELLRAVKSGEDALMPPVIVYTGKDLTREEEEELRCYSESVIIKGERSEERLFDEVSLFLHRLVEELPEKKRQIITNLHDTDALLRDRCILIVDDDMRNVFAISKVLEERGLKTFKAENGRKALELLDKHPEIDLVLMDVMMPVMDGYEAMMRIRSQERFRSLPIIAVTAKAMSKDRKECISAGANDYLSKPVDVGRLISLLRVWMYRG